MDFKILLYILLCIIIFGGLFAYDSVEGHENEINTTSINSIVNSVFNLMKYHWNNRQLECDNFTIMCPENCYIPKNPSLEIMDVPYTEWKSKNEVISLSSKDIEYSTINIIESTEENYTDFMNQNFENQSIWNSRTHSEVYLIKDIKENNMRIVFLEYLDHTYHKKQMVVLAEMKKDNHYYKISMDHWANEEVINSDTRIIRDIYNTIEKRNDSSNNNNHLFPFWDFLKLV